MKIFKESELVLTPDGAVYHLHLHPENLAENIILVGDPDRVPTISRYFDKIDFKMQNRELVTHTGWFNGKRISAISTGMGTDNLDIVINELDATVNIDLKNRCSKDTHTQLNMIRIGTSGGLQEDLEIDSFITSEYGLGIDGLLNFYDVDSKLFETEMEEAFLKHMNWPQRLARPYIIKASESLKQKVAFDLKSGITATAPGFYAPQGRELRIPLAYPDMNDKIETFSFNHHKITNFEMETSALYGLGQALGHNTLTVCAIIANRVTRKFSSDYKVAVEKLVLQTLQRLTE